MEPKPIANTQNVINTGELFARVTWLEQELNYRCSDEYSAELKTLKSFAEKICANASAGTFEPGQDMIRDTYFQEYIKTAEEDDVESASKAAFIPIDFKGIIYWMRTDT